jgi:branched-chain amino acid transport system ATP-binding protein
MLELSGICAGYAGGPVIWDIDLSVAPGEMVTLIGANGAGKSTLVKTVSGLIAPASGHMTFHGRRIEALSPAARVRLGMAHVPEGRQVFSGLTALENLTLGAYVHRRTHAGATLKERLDAVRARFPALERRMADLAGNFSGGQQQMLAIARGLMSDPRLLLLDEPSLGLSPLLVSAIFDLVRGLRDGGLAILLSEQNARSALAISDRGYVIESGRVTLHGPARDLLASPEIAERYLGGTETAAAPAIRIKSMSDRIRALV